MCEILNVCDENKLDTHVVFVMYAGECNLSAFGIPIALARVYSRNHTKWSWPDHRESTYNQDTHRRSGISFLVSSCGNRENSSIDTSIYLYTPQDPFHQSTR